MEKICSIISNRIESLYLFLKKHLAIVIIIVTAIIMALMFYSGIYNISDDVRVYIPNMHALLNGEFQELEPPIRLPILIVEAISYYLFGQDVYLIPYTFTMIFPTIVLLVYILAIEIFNKKVAIISSLCILTITTIYTLGGTILPDNLTMIFVLLAYIFLIKAIKAETDKTEWIFLFLCSISCFCTFLMKEFYLVMFAGFFPLVAYYKKNVLSYALKVGIMFFLLFIPYKVMLAISSKSFKLTTFAEFPMEGNDLVRKHVIDYNTKRGSLTLPDHFMYAVKMLYQNAKWLIIPQVVFSSILCYIGIKEKKKIYYVFSLSAIALFLVLAFGSISLTEFLPIPLSPRYFIGVNIFLSIQTGVILNYYNLLNSKKIGNITLVIVLIAGGFFIQNLSIAGKVGETKQFQTFNDVIQIGYDTYEKPIFIYDEKIYLYIQASNAIRDKYEFVKWDEDINITEYDNMMFISDKEEGMIEILRVECDKLGYKMIVIESKHIGNQKFIEKLLNLTQHYQPVYYGFILK